tara:strand:+ start:24996 stop:25451 length:456 start_codon:yes stop_codon:yes gene_type:complete
MVANPISLILNRLYAHSHLQLLVESMLLALAFPLVRFFVRFVTDTVHLNVSVDRLLYVFCIAPWFETLICFVPIIEILRKIKVESWVVVLIASIVFAVPHTSFILGLYLGVVFSSVYVIARRFSFLHAFVYSTAVHFVYNLLIIGLYSVAS